MIKIERSNFQAICRTCLKNLETTSATSSKYGIRETPNLMKLLMICTTLNINEDTDEIYPQLLCCKCYQTLQDFQRFRDMALQSNVMLREVVENEDGVVIAPGKSNAQQEKYTIDIKSEATTDEEFVDTFKAEETELTSSFYVYDVEEAIDASGSLNNTENNNIETCDDENTALSDAQDCGNAIFEKASTSARAKKRKSNVNDNDTDVQPKKRLAGVLNGPDIRKLMRNSDFEGCLVNLELVAWDNLKAVIEHCLGKVRREDWRVLIGKLLSSFESINVNMSLKVHFLHNHIDWFERQIPTESDEHGERFHQIAAPLEHWYSGKRLDSLLADLCWNLINESEDE